MGGGWGGGQEGIGVGLSWDDRVEVIFLSSTWKKKIPFFNVVVVVFVGELSDLGPLLHIAQSAACFIPGHCTAVPRGRA